MMGFLLSTVRDNVGRSGSLFFAGTDEGRLMKQDFGTKIDAQIVDLEAMLRMTEMEARGVDQAFRELHKAVGLRPGEQKVDWGRRVLAHIFKWDISK